jgi:hypothetical protein
MTYKYYKFPNKESVPPLNRWPKEVSVNEVGVILNNNGIYSERGIEIQSPTPIEGWHVNVCYQGQVNLNFVKDYEINVTSPRCKWMGQ